MGMQSLLVMAQKALKKDKIQNYGDDSSIVKNYINHFQQINRPNHWMIPNLLMRVLGSVQSLKL